MGASSTSRQAHNEYTSYAYFRIRISPACGESISSHKSPTSCHSWVLKHLLGSSPSQCNPSIICVLDYRTENLQVRRDTCRDASLYPNLDSIQHCYHSILSSVELISPSCQDRTLLSHLPSMCTFSCGFPVEHDRPSPPQSFCSPHTRVFNVINRISLRYVGSA